MTGKRLKLEEEEIDAEEDVCAGGRGRDWGR